MRLYVVENMSRREAATLRAAGHDVLAVNEVPTLQGVPDAKHALNAEAEQRVLVTKDGDYGGLRAREGVPLSGVLYLKPSANTPDLAERLPAIVARHEAVLTEGAFVAVDARRERVRHPDAVPCVPPIDPA